VRKRRRDMNKIKKEEFLNNLKEALEVEDDETLAVDTNLKDLEEYDSLSVLVIVTMVEKKFKKQIPSSDFEKVTTVNSLISLIGEEYFE
jgi:acyl carrier protein